MFPASIQSTSVGRRLTLFAGALCVVSFLYWAKYVAAKPFDSDTWKEGSTYRRGQKVWDLRSERFIGMAESDVVDILGEPEYRTGHEANYVFDAYRVIEWSEMFIVEFHPQS